MPSPGFTLLKTFIKSSLDNYVLPGTLTGTEIMLFYLIHWKRKLYLITTGVLHIVSTDLDLYKVEETPVESSEMVGTCEERNGVCAESRNALS